MENKNHKKNKFELFKIRKNIYIALYILIPLFLIISISLLILSQNKKVETLDVTEKSTIDYSVCVKENDYYEEKCLDKGMQYIANLIDYVDVKLNYELLAEEKVNYEYKYRIEAVVNVFAKNDPSNVIFTDTNTLVEEKTKTIKDKQLLNLNEEVKIEYNKYNERVRNFKRVYGVNADSNILIKLYVTPVIKYDSFGRDINKKEAVMQLSIPLTENQINIKAATNDINKVETFEHKVTSLLDYVYLIGSIITGILTLVMTFFLLLEFTKKSRNRSPYQKAIDKILREYDYIISESDTIIDPEETEYSYTDMKNFKDLKEMAINTDKQIIYSELKELKKPHRTWFYIINEDDKRIYRYCVEDKKTKNNDK